MQLRHLQPQSFMTHLQAPLLSSSSPTCSATAAAAVMSSALTSTAIVELAVLLICMQAVQTCVWLSGVAECRQAVHVCGTYLGARLALQMVVPLEKNSVNFASLIVGLMLCSTPTKLYA